VSGESLGQALDRAFAERIKLPEGDTAHAGAPIQDTRAAPIPGPPSPPTDKDKGQDKAQEKAEANGDVDQPTETTAAGIAQAGHEQTDAVDPSLSSSAPHSGGPTGGLPDTHACTFIHAHTHARRQHTYEQVACCTFCRACLRMVCSLHAATCRHHTLVLTKAGMQFIMLYYVCMPCKAAARSASVGALMGLICCC